jgi:hypothetical protein
VVDFASEFAGKTSSNDLQRTNISHSGPTLAFGVATLLNGSSTEFNSFTLQPINPDLDAQIDAVFPYVNLSKNLSHLHPLGPVGGGAPSAAGTVYQFTIDPASDPPSWYAQVVLTDRPHLSIASSNWPELEPPSIRRSYEIGRK